MSVATYEGPPRPVGGTSETISLYLDLKPGQKADFEVVGRTAAAFADVVKEIAYVLEPGLEIKLEFESGTEGSLKLNAILRATTSKKAIRASLLTIVLAVSTAFYRKLPDDLRQYGISKVLDAFLMPDSKKELTETDVQRIAKAVKDLMDGRIAKEPIRQVYKEIDRDTAIEAVGTITKPDTKPPAPVPREEFPVRAGVVQAIETEPKKRQKTTIERLTLTRPVLVEADRVWRFTSPLGEQSYVIDPKVQKDLLSGKRNIQLKSGIQMTVKIVTVEVLEGGVWVVKERRIVDIIRVHRQAKSDLFSEPKERESRAKKKRRPK